MNTETIDVASLEASRRHKASATTPPDPISVQQSANEWQAAFDRMLSRTRQQRQALQEWAQTQPQTKICQTHQFVRKIDWDKSTHESHLAGKHLLFYVPCPTCLKFADIIRRSEWMIQRGVPKSMAHCSFENFVASNQDEAKVLEQARKFARVKRGFFIILGDPGLGKTHLGVAIMRQIVSGRFITNAQMLAQVRARYNDPSVRDIVLLLQKESLLIFDEIGISDGGSDEFPKLHQIFVARYDSFLPTVITGNLTRPRLEEYLGQRLADRLSEACFCLAVLKGQSHRKVRRDEYFKGAE